MPEPYRLSDDVIAVQRGPEPGGLGGAYRVFGATLRGLRTTFGRLGEKPPTIQYPEEKTPVYPRFRGRHKLQRFEDSGLEKCVGCSLCVAACPAECIRVVAAENTPDNQVSAGERYAAVYEINMTRCIFCGYCEVACPVRRDHHGQRLRDGRLRALGPHLHEGDAAGGARRANAAAARGRVGAAPCSSSRSCSSWPASARSPARCGVALLRNPFYSVLALVGHLIALAVLFLLLRADFLAAAQVVVYAGAVMVLYVFVVAYVGGSDDPLRPEAGGLLTTLGPLFAFALFVEISIAVVGSSLGALDTNGPDVGGRLRLAGRDRAPAAHQVPAALRGGLVPAAAGGGGAPCCWPASAAGWRPT